jgi:hypothetical protein
MKTCIYIHGLESKGGSHTASVLREEFAGVLNIIEPVIDYADIQSVVETIKATIAANPDCFLIGSSLGGFVALQFPETPFILINPALRPSEIGRAQQHPILLPQLPVFLQMEKAFTERVTRKLRANDFIEGQSSYGLFGTNDEYFSYLNEFKQDLDRVVRTLHIFTCTDGHRLSEPTVRTKVVALVELLLQDIKIDEYLDANFTGWIDEEFAAEMGIKLPIDEKFEQLDAERKKILKRLNFG